MIHLAITLRALLHIVQIFINSLFLVGCGEFRHEVTLRSQYHEGDTEHRIGTSGEDGEVFVRVSHLELYLSTLRTSNPVALSLFQRVSPVNFLQTVQQALCVGTDTQTPLAHLLLYDGIAATNADTVNHLVIRQYRTQFRTPVHHRISQIGNTIVHQHLLLLLFRESSPFRGCEVQFLCAQGITVLSTHQFEVLNQFNGRLSLV